MSDEEEIVKEQLNKRQEMVNRQREWLDYLKENISAAGEFRVARDVAGKPSKWAPYSNYRDVRAVDYRSVFHNEIIFDIDDRPWRKVYDILYEIIDFLESQGIPHVYGMSGGKGAHIHVFFDLKPIKEGTKMHRLKEKAKGYGVSTRDFRVWFWHWILDNVGFPKSDRGHGKRMDSSVIDWRDESLGHLIRCFCGRKTDERGELKSYKCNEHCTPIKRPEKRPDYAHPPPFKKVSKWMIPHALQQEFYMDMIDKRKEDKRWKPVEYEGKYLNLPCIKRLREKGCATGMRNEMAFALAIACRLDGLTEEEAKDVVDDFGMKVNLPFKECHYCVRSAYGSDDRDWFFCRKLKVNSICTEDEFRRCEIDNKRFSGSKDLLMSSNFLENVADVVHRLGVVGEDDLIKQLFLILLTKEFAEPQAIVITGESSSGKSYTLDKVKVLFPEEDIFEFSRITASVLDRWKGVDLNGKILIVKELEGGKYAQEKLRVGISEGGLSLLTTKKDKDGNITTEEIKTKGFPLFITTSVNCELEEQMLTRTFLFTTDDSEKQTKDIIDYRLNRKGADKIVKRDKTLGEDIEEIKDALRILFQMQKQVVYPFNDAINVPHDRVRMRRDIKKILVFIDSLAYLRQLNRDVIEVDGEKYVLAHLYDLLDLMDFGESALANTLLGVPERYLKIFNWMLEKSPDGLTVDQLVQQRGMKKQKVRSAMRYLNEQGMMITHQSMKDKRKNIYTPVEIDLNKDIQLKSIRESCEKFFDKLGPDYDDVRERYMNSLPEDLEKHETEDGEEIYEEKEEDVEVDIFHYGK